MKKMIVLCLILTALLVGCSKAPTGAVSADVAESGDDNIGIPLSQVTDKVQKFEFDSNGVTIRYFVVKDGDAIKTAFDGCDVCGGNKGGYEQQGSDVKCLNCGRMFKISDLGTKNKGGGCWPGYLPHEIVGDNVIIKKSDLAKGASRFR